MFPHDWKNYSNIFKPVLWDKVSRNSGYFLRGGRMPQYYPINEDAARQAKEMNSFSDYQPGSATAGYQAMVDKAAGKAEQKKDSVVQM